MKRNKIINFLKKHLSNIVFMGLIAFSVIVFYNDLQNTKDQNFFAFSVNQKNLSPEAERVDAVVREIDANSGEAVIDVTLTVSKVKIMINQDDTIMSLLSPKEEALFGTKQTTRSVTHGFMQLSNYEDTTNRSEYSIKDLRVLLDWNGLPFPFDAYDFDVTFQPYTTYTQESEAKLVVVAETLTVLMDDTNFIYRTSQTKLDYLKTEFKNFPDLPDTTAHIKIKRPFHIQLQVTAIIILLLFIVGWTFYRINQISVTTNASLEILGLNLGVILAIPSIRDSIVPEGLKKVPLIDFGVNLIIMLSMVSLATYLIKLYWQSKGSTSKKK